MDYSLSMQSSTTSCPPCSDDVPLKPLTKRKKAEKTTRRKAKPVYKLSIDRPKRGSCFELNNTKVACECSWTDEWFNLLDFFSLLYTPAMPCQPAQPIRASNEFYFCLKMLKCLQMGNSPPFALCFFSESKLLLGRSRYIYIKSRYIRGRKGLSVVKHLAFWNGDFALLELDILRWIFGSLLM